MSVLLSAGECLHAVRRARPARVGFALALLGFPSLAASTEAAAQTDTVALSRTFQYAIPSAPAFDFLGASPSEVTRPTTPRALASALVSGVSAAGQFQQGVAIDVAPFQITQPRLDLAGYQTLGGFIRSNLSLSLGTVRGSGDTAATNVGLGARLVLVDRTDPLGPASRVAGDSMINVALDSCLPPTRPANGADVAEIKRVRQCVARLDSTFRANWRAVHWNDFAVSVAGATGWGFRRSIVSDRQHLGASGWALGAAPLCLRSAARGLCRRGQWLGKAQYEDRDTVPGTPRLRQLTAGLRGTLGSASFNAFAEGLYRRRNDTSPGIRRTRHEWSTGVEFRLGDALWVSTGFGGRYDDLTQKTKALMLAGLRFNLSPKQQFTSIAPNM